MELTVRMDLTRWVCDRCKGEVSVELNHEPSTTWQGLEMTTIHESSRLLNRPRPPTKKLLCNTCANTLERWLRNDPPHTVPGEPISQTITVVPPGKELPLEVRGGECYDPHYRWTTCVIHGTCTCPREGSGADPYDAACPLHAHLPHV